ncbi:PadR family transcriptional regulator [Georgenia halophila]
MKFDDILLALILRKPITGYDAKKWLDTEGIFMRANADQSQIYRTLHRLARNGLIEAKREQRDGAPDAKVYSATPAGAQHLRELATTQYEPPPRWQEPDFMVRYNVLGVLQPQVLIPLIETEIHFRRDQIARFRGRDRHIQVAPTHIPIDRELAQEILDSSHEYSAGAMDDWIAWLEEQLLRWRARLQVPASTPPGP